MHALGTPEIAGGALFLDAPRHAVAEAPEPNFEARIRSHDHCVWPLDEHFCVGLIEDGGQAAREDPGADSADSIRVRARRCRRLSDPVKGKITSRSARISVFWNSDEGSSNLRCSGS